MRRFKLSLLSSVPDFVVTRPSTTFLPFGSNRSGPKPPARSLSHSMKKPSTPAENIASTTVS